MKNFLLFLFFTATAVVSLAAADNPSVDGKWRVHTSVAGNDSDMVCTLTQKDGAISGNCVTDNGKVDVMGKIDGDKASWSYKTDYQGSPLTVKYDGVVEATGIKGNVEVPEYSVSGDFTATPAK